MACKIVERSAQQLPAAAGRPLSQDRRGPDAGGNRQVLAPRRRALARLRARLEAIADVLRALVLETPPNVIEGGWLAAHAAKLINAGRHRQTSCASSTLDAAHAICSICSRSSAGDYLDGWFESDPIKAVLGFDGIVGNYASPYTPGSAYVLLHHVFGEVNGKKGAWGHAIGGMGAITQAMAKAARPPASRSASDAGVREVIVEEGPRGRRRHREGRAPFARAIVVSNLNPKLLIERLIAGRALPPASRERMANWRCGSGTFRMNVALSRIAALHRAARARAIT